MFLGFLDTCLYLLGALKGHSETGGMFDLDWISYCPGCPLTKYELVSCWRKTAILM